jgi:hypothetical protein
MMNQNQNPQNAIFEVLDQVPSQFWYTLGIGSIAMSALFQATGNKNAADFVGKWPPTFLLIGLYHKLLRPSTEDAAGDAKRLVDKAQQSGREMLDKASQTANQTMEGTRQTANRTTSNF